MQQQALAQEEARGALAREMQAKLQITYEPVLTQNIDTGAAECYPSQTSGKAQSLGECCR